MVGSGLLPSLNNAADFTGAPTEITHKYVVGEIIGDGESLSRSAQAIKYMYYQGADK